jgi:hypothetical protein
MDGSHRRHGVKDDALAIMETAPECAVTRTGKGRPMKARLLKKWGGNYAGQVLTNVEQGSIPAGVAEFFEDDDPAINTVVPQVAAGDPLSVINDEINPETAKQHNDAQRALAKSSREVVDQRAVFDALETQEKADTQDRARKGDLAAAKRVSGAGTALTAGQKKKMKAGK